MKNEPKKIYFQIGDPFDGDIDGDDFAKLEEVTWCRNRIWETDLEYFSISVLRRLAEKWKRQAAQLRKSWPDDTTAPNTIEIVIEDLEKLFDEKE